MEHPREADVDGVARASGDAHHPVGTRDGGADEVELVAVDPGGEVVVLVDEREDVLEASLDLALRPDEPRHQCS